MNLSIETANATEVWCLFGLSGCGKSFAGDAIARQLGWRVYHADEDLTPAMRQALQEAKPFTDAMRQEFFVQLAEKIQTLRVASPVPLIVTQGVYRQRHRDYLCAAVPGLKMLWIKAGHELICSRIEKRTSGINLQSAMALLSDFELPPADWLVLENDADQGQLLARFASLRGS